MPTMKESKRGNTKNTEKMNVDDVNINIASRRRQVLRCVKRIPLILFSILGGLTNILVLCVIYKLVAKFKKNRGRRTYKLLKFYCYHLMISYLGLFFTRPFYFTGSVKKFKTKNNISIFNHSSDFDWVFILVIYYNLNMYETLFFLMKQELGKIPFLGYLVRANGHMMLSRKNKEKDLSEIKRGIARYNRGNNNFSIFLFPEGTYPHAETIEKTKEFAAKTKITVNDGEYMPHNTLIPRKTGFNTVKSNTDAKYIYNGLIINNPYFLVLSEHQSILSYFLFEKFSLQPVIFLNVVENNNLTEDYVYECFDEKDKIIEEYKKFNDTIKVVKKSKTELETIFNDISNNSKHKIFNNNVVLDELYVKSKFQKHIFIATTVFQVCFIWGLKKLCNKLI